MELTKIEAFNLWIQTQPATDEQISAQILLHRVTAKINHTFKTLRSQLHQVSSEKDDLQTRVEQQKEERPHPYAWEHLLGSDKIEDPGNAITITMKIWHHPLVFFNTTKPTNP